MSSLGPEELLAFLRDAFPLLPRDRYEVREASAERLLLALRTSAEDVRPGGSVSGPALMELADTAAFLRVVSRYGPVALALTTQLDIHFLRRASPGTIVASARFLRAGRRLAVMAIDITMEAEADPVAHVTTTYSLPSR